MAKVKEKHKKQCPKCEQWGTSYLERSGPHIKWICSTCGYIKFLEQRPGEFVMPFGLYKGFKLDHIFNVDQDYVAWMALNLRNDTIKMKAKQLLTERG